MNTLLNKLAFGLVACTAVCTATAGEVYLDTVRATTGGYSDTVVSTERAYRTQGAYFGLQGGVSSRGSASFRNELGGAELEDESGFVLGARAGYWFRIPFPIRPSLEVELNYLRDDVSVGGTVSSEKHVGRVTGGGDLSAFVGTVNLVLALDLEPYRDQVGDVLAAFHPYVGAGIGAAYSSLEDFSLKIRDEEGGEKKVDAEGSKIDFAYQVFGGLEIDLSEEFSIYGEYKRMVLEGTGTESITDYERDLWVLGFKVNY